jgi:hypothetical protein
MWIKSLLLLLALAGSAQAHSWYDPECCNTQDCRPVETEDVVEIENGVWKYLPTGQEFRGKQIRPSRDNHFHVCIGNQPWNDGRAYCIYILSGS